ncbi:MAG TPA: transglycosylase SLT domain-containing protein [Candidatus Solibacter sp.]|nr:transglycosylase SLT domain-containing protein [Candidatus Solibacter sp.]
MAAFSVLSTTTGLGATADSLAALAAQRQALQAQANSVLGQRQTTLSRLLQTKDLLATLRGQLDQNASKLAELQSQQEDLRAGIEATSAHMQTDRDLLAGIVRQQYKTRGDSKLSQILFDSSNLSQIVDRIVATEAISSRAHDLIVELRVEQSTLNSQSAALAAKQAEANRLRDRLTAQKKQVQAVAADYQTQVDSMDANAQALLARIKAIDAAIAALTSPPSGGRQYTQQQIIAIIRGAAAQYGANGDQMVRVARCESSLNPYAYNRSSGASGLFQFMPGTFYGNGGHNIWDPTDQSDVAAKMFARGDSGAWSCK